MLTLAATVVHLNILFARWVWFRLRFVEDRTMLVPSESGPFADAMLDDLDPEIAEIIGDGFR